MIRPAGFLFAGIGVAFGALALRIASLPVERPVNSAIKIVSATKQGVQRETDGQKHEVAKDANGQRKAESRLTLQAARLGGASGRDQRIVSYPMEFRAGEGETVGAIRALVLMPGAGWKFLRAEMAPGSRLKASIQQHKRNRDQTRNLGESVEVNINAGAQVIRNGIIGVLQFTVRLADSREPSTSPVIRILSTSPPQTEQVRKSAEAPFDLSPSAPANPNVSCFFFSH